ncbi:HAD family hydrolase [Verrucomicrobiaceae bacterium R5-34]|uniref:phosphoglycolate phosphatase n=1 Tax=Oceaniferula flava TaxID=2800421 RepID=A0AAE2SAP2_9BACT|nr:HAD family hydrolase [Oceaniferula flavus]MBK1832095.1 HAD family hydrolase [Verrucomicrobiaceae bacterium R5-34]MBK1854179.1 HAD family hydrolase [Oceaniferula flavus]MBM1135485.1 HAD family hydrolase [Oceaniferula flavus]
MKEKIHSFENWIFDWSGTLVDDLAMVLDATNHVLRHYGKEQITRDEFRLRFRLPYVGFYEEILPNIPLDELEDHFRVGFANSAASGVISPLLPHAMDFLQFLQSRNRRMFILSSMDAQAFEGHAEELAVAQYFESSYAGVLDKREQIHQLLETHQLDASKTVFLGDMTHDVDTARHGGVASIALLTGYQNEQQLLSSEPDWIANDLSVVRSVLESSTPSL